MCPCSCKMIGPRIQCMGKKGYDRPWPTVNTAYKAYTMIPDARISIDLSPGTCLTPSHFALVGSKLEIPGKYMGNF